MPVEPRKVLVVEDSRAINDLLICKLNEELHIDVLSASSFEQAERILDTQSDEIFVAILDLNLPDAPNGEIVDLVIDRGIPPIVLTGAISDDIHDEMIEKPIIDYVMKLNLNEIQYVIDSVKRLRENRGRKVLVVDDSKVSRKLLAALLERQFLTVIDASSGKQALEILSKDNDIIMMITDYNMPEMDGAELITRVRNKFSRNELFIIGISAAGSGSTSIKLLKSGANDFISRPFMHEEFYCRINQGIDAIVNYQSLKTASDYDYLTGIYNRNYFYTTGEKLFKNAQHNQLPIMVAIADIDFLNNINDTHGHSIGDETLQQVATIFSQQARESSIVARLGGDKFCFLCMNAEDDGYDKRMDVFRKKILQTPFIFGDLTVNITVSIGYTTQLTDSLNSMVNDADLALHHAKKGGRNMVVNYADIINS